MNEDIQWFIEKLFDSSPLNHLPENFGGGRIFAKPLTGVARGDDPIFLKFKTVVGPKHATPEEMWIQSGLPKRKDLPSQLRILSIIFPLRSIRYKSGFFPWLSVRAIVLPSRAQAAPVFKPFLAEILLFTPEAISFI